MFFTSQADDKFENWCCIYLCDNQMETDLLIHYVITGMWLVSQMTSLNDVRMWNHIFRFKLTSYFLNHYSYTYIRETGKLIQNRHWINQQSYRNIIYQYFVYKGGRVLNKFAIRSSLFFFKYDIFSYKH